MLKDHGFSQKEEPRIHPRQWARQDQLTTVGAALPPALPPCSHPRDPRLPALGPLTVFFSSPVEQTICELKKLPTLTLTSYLFSLGLLTHQSDHITFLIVDRIFQNSRVCVWGYLCDHHHWRTVGCVLGGTFVITITGEVEPWCRCLSLLQDSRPHTSRKSPTYRQVSSSHHHLDHHRYEGLPSPDPLLTTIKSMSHQQTGQHGRCLINSDFPSLCQLNVSTFPSTSLMNNISSKY